MNRLSLNCLVFVLFGVVFLLMEQETALAFERPSWLFDKRSAGEEAVLTRLKGTGFSAKPELYIRLFKLEKTLEVWIRSKAGFKLYKSYGICRYSGKLGPKLEEGDKQSPEGFYHIPAEDLGWHSARWPRALNLSFPNVFDGLKGRSGSFLLIHGGCFSKGCYALENGPMDELFALVSLAARTGQRLFPIHIFPFRLTTKNWAIYKSSKWAPFWRKLQPVFDQFNAKRFLPAIHVCKSGYEVAGYLPVFDGERLVRGKCIAPLPLMSVDNDPHSKLSWVIALRREYGKRVRTASKVQGAQERIKVVCNLKRPSCKRWLALRRRMLKRGVLPKSLLR